MTREFERLQGLIAKQTSVERDRITPEATLESLGLDSLDFIER